MEYQRYLKLRAATIPQPRKGTEADSLAAELYSVLDGVALELEAAEEILASNWEEIPECRAFILRRRRMLRLADETLRKCEALRVEPRCWFPEDESDDEN